MIDTTEQRYRTGNSVETLVQALEGQQQVIDILRLAVQPRPLPEVLQQCIDILLSTSWLSILHKGGIFLVSEAPEVLRLVAQRNLGEEILSLCNEVPFGHCLCGQAAQSREVVYAPCIDERHATRFSAMAPHGHYNVPILADHDVLGVLVVYLLHGHKRDEREVDFLKSIADILSLVIRQKYAEEELKSANHRLTYLAHTDELTRLYNRRFFMQRLEEEVQEATRFERPLSVLLLDVDHFKQVNDNHGHDAGDGVLKAISESLLSGSRQYDFAGRYGGEEFCLVLPNADGRQAIVVAERLRERIAAHKHQVDADGAIGVTASIGVASLTQGEDAADLLKNADTALYRAKNGGRNQVMRT